MLTVLVAARALAGDPGCLVALGIAVTFFALRDLGVIP